MEKKPRISPRKEEVLSYLVGLAPLGTPFVVQHSAERDLHMTRLNLAQFIRRLQLLGAIDCAKPRSGSAPQIIRVLKRPEDFEFYDHYNRPKTWRTANRKSRRKPKYGPF